MAMRHSPVTLTEVTVKTIVTHTVTYFIAGLHPPIGELSGTAESEPMIAPVVDQSQI